MNPYDLAEEIVRDITDGDPLADLTEEDAVRLIAKAHDLGYDIPDILTPDLFIAIFEFLKPEQEEEAPRCEGDGWHKVGDAKVFVEDRVITRCFTQDANGKWIERQIKRWSRAYYRFERAGGVTVSALRSGLARGTIIID